MFQGDQVPNSLRDRCVYIWEGASKPDPDGLPVADLLEFDADLPVVGLATLPTLIDITREGRTHLSGDVGMPPPALWPAANEQVVIGFPDSSPANTGAALIPLDGNAHGFNMAWISRFLTCQSLTADATKSTGCYTTPITELGIDRSDAASAASDESLRGLAHGAAYGSRTGFARAIDTIVTRWRSNPNRKLIINIAAGWEPTFECTPLLVASQSPSTTATATPVDVQPAGEWNGSKDQLQLQQATAQGARQGNAFQYPTVECGNNHRRRIISRASQDVYDALRRAACQGAIVVAATGNDHGGEPMPSGALFPAGWEVVDAPSVVTCRELGFPLPAAEPRPLVHAVYGVDGKDLPIVVSRRDSRSKLAAPASLLVGYPDAVRDGYPCPAGQLPPCIPSYRMTGTSVAATVVSSVAAAVWARNTDLTPAEVMRRVYLSGVELRQTSNFGWGTSEQPMRRVSLCRAVACAGGEGDACVRLANEQCALPDPYRGNPPPAAFTFTNGIVERRTGTAVSGGSVTGQPVNPCPSCFLVINTNGDTQGYPATLRGVIDGQFFDDTRESNVHDASVTVIDQNQTSRSLTWDSPPTPTYTKTGDPTVSIAGHSPLIPVTAFVSWTGDPSGQVYTQEIPVYR